MLRPEHLRVNGLGVAATSTLMDATAAYRSTTAAPRDRPVELIDARELPPPGPLKRTLEALPALEDDVVLLQLNDRAPQLLYPKLDDRGYRYETVEVDGGVVTAIWRE